MNKAQFWEPAGGMSVQCHLCPHNCIIQENRHGICKIRVNKEGILYAREYGRVVSMSIDPMEKKPLYHFYPGSDILSVGANGCNFSCEFCQNWQVSQYDQPTRYVAPEELINVALKHQSVGIAYTYTEPLIWFEYVYDCSKLANEKGLKNVLVTNGYINPKPARELLPYIDALNIDLKSIDPDFYANLCGGKIEPVKAFIKQASKQAHVELTNLVIPTKNDSDDQLDELCRFVASVDENIPLHFSAYFPQYKMDVPRTPVETLLKARKIAQKYLRYVYLGNVHTSVGTNTVCPGCGALLIERNGYDTHLKNIHNGRCGQCNKSIPIAGV
ncbi:MAG: AmmeMemoRadiSam system radical SAM enzyme [Candidatus Auribacterota bacterium]|jgi:pyruvate formate lyase activating enzyme|nr:AmmeMemoRadiSam system radical SAM enzyme [Candidatus Auribacterota bacterium]